ncbi:hypothetical protein AB9E34_33100, partial [Rhizobium leguminosarum]
TAVIASNILIVPKTSRIRDDLAVVVRFFDGDGDAALDYLRRQDPKNPSARAPIPGVSIMIRRQFFLVIAPGQGRTCIGGQHPQPFIGDIGNA